MKGHRGYPINRWTQKNPATPSKLEERLEGKERGDEGQKEGHVRERKKEVS